MAGVLEVVIVLVILYCVFNSRASAMVDVLSARMQAVYTNWDRGPDAVPAKKVSAATLRRYGPTERREKFRALSNDSLQQSRDRELLRVKDSPWVAGFPVRPLRPVMGLACKACTPDSKMWKAHPWGAGEFCCGGSYRSMIRSFKLLIDTKENCSLNRSCCVFVSICIALSIFDAMMIYGKNSAYPYEYFQKRKSFKKVELVLRETHDDFSFDYSSKRQEVQDILKTETEKSKSFLKRTFCHIVHIWRFKKFNFPQVSDKVLSSNTLMGALEDTTKELLEKTLKQDPSASADDEELFKRIYKNQEARARKILKDMRSTLSDFLLRVTTWLLYKLFPRFLSSVCLHPSHLAMIQKAASTNLPLIFVPLHRSHLDYILITFILQNIKVKSPLVAAGNNLKIPVFGSLLRGLGAFFIKRRIDPVTGRKDILYRAILHTYMIECLRAGHNIEFYIEGGRTRTGKPCMPKGGLLSVIVGAYMDGTVEDALLVPVSVNYDKLVDGNFISELLGQPKQMETFSTAISAIWTTLNSNYGSIRIDFNQPFSLRELVKSFQGRSGRLSQSDVFSSNESESSSFSKKNGFQKEKSFRSVPSTTSLYGTDVIDENHRALVDKIARHLIYDCSKACAIMSTNTLAFLLLNKYRTGVSFVELVGSFDKLRHQLSSDNRDVGYSGESADVIEHAIKLLGPGLVKREKLGDPKNPKETVDFITPITVLPNVIGLSYYSNSLLTHFMVEGVVATSICSSVKADTDSQLTISLDDLMRNALDLCDIFQFEFIFAKPCESLEHVINEAVDKFKYMDIISTQEAVKLEYEDWSQNIAKAFDDSEDDEFYQHKPPPTFLVNSSEEAEEKLELFHMMLRPFVDAYLGAATCLPSLVNKRSSENEFVKEVLAEIKSQLLSGRFPYGESSSVDLIKNALKLFKKWGVLDMYNEDSVRLLCLTETYNGEEELRAIAKRICHFKFLHESDKE